MDNLSAVESIFLAALEKTSSTERAAYLDDACAGDPSLRQRVERLLAAHPKAGSFLQVTGPELTGPFAEQSGAERPGSQIGPYKLLELLGEGGMGMVFVAEQQEPVRRKVALKVIKPGMDSREVIARFEAERQALAMMDHPNIAKVLDAGTTGEKPYFVMELVKGVPITDYCDQERFSPRQRLELFVPVCQAVQHAHQKGIIHRDLKPSNVLVSSHDGTPVVKVIDFGIAKAIEQQLTDKTIYTRVAQLIGTPLYMSPEQAGMSDLDIDTRSDVYSLGVLLYELLTGTTPFDPKRLAKVAFDEMRRILREEDPPRPSTRLSTLGETLSAVSARRRTEPRRLPGLVRGDLDWIVMKALEKDRTRRYETASAFAADVRRFLGEEPVEARPPSAWYRFRKFARRHRTAAFLAGFVTVMLAALLITETVGYFQIKAARDHADTERKAAQDAAKREETERIRAQNAKEKLRENLYEVETSLLQPAWESDSLARFDQLLDGQRPAPGERDLRAFEWHYWNRLRHAEQPGVKLASESRLGARLASPPVLSPDGSRIAAVAVENGQGALCVWDTSTGKLVQKLMEGLDYRQPLLAAPLRIAFSGDSRRVAVSQLGPKNPGDVVTLFKPVQADDLIGNRLLLRVWDIATGRKLLDHAVDNFTSPPLGMALSLDGRLLAFSTPVPDPKGEESRLHLWEVDMAREMAIHPLSDTPSALAFSPDGARLAAVLSTVRRMGPQLDFVWYGQKLQLWQVDPWQEMPINLPRKPEQLTPEAIAFGSAPPGGEGRLAVFWGDAGHKKTLTVYALGKEKGKELCTIRDEITGTQPVFDPSGSRISCDAAGSIVRVWDADKGNVLFSVRGHEKTPAVVFRPDGHLVTAGADGIVKEWAQAPPPSAPNGIEKGDNFCPLAVALGRDGTRLARAVAGADRSTLTVRLWDADHGNFRTPIEVKTGRPLGGVRPLALSADGRRLAAVVLMNPPPGAQLRVWDTSDGRELFASEIIDLHGLPIAALTLSADGSRVALACAGEVTAWDVTTGASLLQVKDSWKLLMFLTLSRDGKRLAWASDRRVRLWDVDAARKAQVLGESGEYVGPVAFSHDGRYLAACVGGAPMNWTEVKVWDADTAEERLNLKGEKGLQDIAFSPDGRRIATLQAEPFEKPGAVVKLRDSVSGLLLLRLDCPERGPANLHFSADGSRLLLVHGYPSQPGDGWREEWNATPLPDREPVPAARP
jgi:serine/threonine protein kinase/WD40 repeat protein